MPPPLPTSLLQPVGFQRTLSSPSQPESPPPANDKLRSDQMINGSNGPPVQVAAPPSPFDPVIQALSDSWNSLKSLVNEPLSGGPFTFGDFLAALPLPGPGIAAKGTEAAGLVAELFEKAGIQTTTHFLKNFVGRASRGVTAENAIDAYRNGRLYFDPKYATYIRYSTRTGIAVATDAPSNGKVLTVLVGDVRKRWNPVPWRPGQ